MDGYVGVVFDARTGLHHGALYRNRPTPSGCDRYLLSVTLDRGERTAREAGVAGNAAFPEATAVDVGTLPEVDVAATAFAPGSTVTLVTPASDEARREGGPTVEVGWVRRPASWTSPPRRSVSWWPWAA